MPPHQHANVTTGAQEHPTGLPRDIRMFLRAHQQLAELADERASVGRPGAAHQHANVTTGAQEHPTNTTDDIRMS